MYCLYIECSLPMSSETWEQISSILFQYDALGVDEGEILPPEGELALHAANEFEHALHPGLLDPPLKFKVYFNTKDQASNAQDKVFPFLENLNPNIKLSKEVTKDYSEEWKKNFKPIFANPNWYIRAPWHSPTNILNQIELIIEPGMAFGTGSHETTKACLELIAQVIKSKNNINTVLDFGCGSGILAIALKKLNIPTVFGIDIDPLSIESSFNNAKLNDVIIDCSTDINEFPLLNLDGVVANILKNTLIEFAPSFSKWIRPQGFLILSGLLEDQLPQIKEIYLKHGFSIEKVLIRADSTPEDLIKKHSEPMNWCAILLNKH